MINKYKNEKSESYILMKEIKPSFWVRVKRFAIRIGIPVLFILCTTLMICAVIIAELYNKETAMFTISAGKVILIVVIAIIYLIMLALLSYGWLQFVTECENEKINEKF